jgi:hypothetical protein
MASEAAVIMRRRSAHFIRARRPLEAFHQRPDICQHLSSFVCRFNRHLASAAGPYIVAKLLLLIGSSFPPGISAYPSPLLLSSIFLLIGPE